MEKFIVAGTLIMIKTFAEDVYIACNVLGTYGVVDHEGFTLLQACTVADFYSAGAIYFFF